MTLRKAFFSFLFHEKNLNFTNFYKKFLFFYIIFIRNHDFFIIFPHFQYFMTC